MINKLIEEISNLPLDEKVEKINEIREKLHEISPFKSEPVDFIRWVKHEGVIANDYNPNAVAPKEMELLKHSIEHDGYTQPVVTWKKDDHREVVDGFHRTKVCKTYDSIRERVNGYLPVVTILEDNEGRNDRMASTIRHNRARGKHKVESMSDIIVELKKRRWNDKKIAKELGMDADEVLRLSQVSGIADAFSDYEFSKSWDIIDSEEAFEAKTIIDEDEVING